MFCLSNLFRRCITTADSYQSLTVFSIYGDIQVGDEVVVVCQGSGSSYTAGDVLEY